jgi:uncharacterized RDD family membrane protein YckC
MSTDAATGIDMGAPEVRTVKTVGFGPRLLATVIDGVVLIAISLIVAALVGTILTVLEFYAPGDRLPVDALTILSGVVISVIYYCSAWARSGQTLGKSVVGNKVVSADGGEITWGSALVRYIGYIVNTLLLSIGFLWLVFDKKRQGWHDKLARTYVVDEDGSIPATGEVNIVPEDPNTHWVWLVLWVIVAVGAPALLLGGLLLLNPFLSRGVSTLLHALGL